MTDVRAVTSRIHGFELPTPSPGPAPKAGGAPFGAIAGARTPLTSADAARELGGAWHRQMGSSPSKQTLAVLWAQWALETGRGTRMHGHNFAGLKVTDDRQAGAAFTTTEGYGARAQRVSSRFRTYATAEAGADDYLTTLRVHYPEAFRAASRGEVAGFVDGLVSRSYFTGDPAAYRRGVSQLAAEFSASDGPIVRAPAFLVEGVIRAFGRAVSRD